MAYQKIQYRRVGPYPPTGRNGEVFQVTQRDLDILGNEGWQILAAFYTPAGQLQEVLVGRPVIEQPYKAVPDDAGFDAALEAVESHVPPRRS